MASAEFVADLMAEVDAAAAASQRFIGGPGYGVYDARTLVRAEPDMRLMIHNEAEKLLRKAEVEVSRVAAGTTPVSYLIAALERSIGLAVVIAQQAPEIGTGALSDQVDQDDQVDRADFFKHERPWGRRLDEVRARLRRGAAAVSDAADLLTERRRRNKLEAVTHDELARVLTMLTVLYRHLLGVGFGVHVRGRTLVRLAGHGPGPLSTLLENLAGDASRADLEFALYKARADEPLSREDASAWTSGEWLETDLAKSLARRLYLGISCREALRLASKYDTAAVYSNPSEFPTLELAAELTAAFNWEFFSESREGNSQAGRLLRWLRPVLSVVLAAGAGLPASQLFRPWGETPTQLSRAAQKFLAAGFPILAGMAADRIAIGRYTRAFEMRHREDCDNYVSYDLELRRLTAQGELLFAALRAAYPRAGWWPVAAEPVAAEPVADEPAPACTSLLDAIRGAIAARRPWSFLLVFPPKYMDEPAAQLDDLRALAAAAPTAEALATCGLSLEPGRRHCAILLGRLWRVSATFGLTRDEMVQIRKYFSGVAVSGVAASADSDADSDSSDADSDADSIDSDDSDGASSRLPGAVLRQLFAN